MASCRRLPLALFIMWAGCHFEVPRIEHVPVSDAAPDMGQDAAPDMGQDAGQDAAPDTGPDLWASGTWRELAGSATGGGVSNSGAEAICKGVVVDPKGTPHVHWADASSGRRDIYMKVWDGKGWAALGSSADPGGISQSEANGFVSTEFTCYGGVDFDSTGRPHVAWMQHLQGSQRPVYLRYWNGLKWQELGGSATEGGISGLAEVYWPDLILDGTDRPVVSYILSGNARLRRFDGNGWKGLGGSDQGTGVSSAPVNKGLVDLAAGPGGTFYVAWCDDRSGVYQPYLRRWTGTGWDSPGNSDTVPIEQTGKDSNHIHVKLTSKGDPVVSWLDNNELYVRYWDGSAWRRYGSHATLNLAGLANPTTIEPNSALDGDDHPVVLWSQVDTLGRNIHGARWDGVSWQRLWSQPGGASNTATVSAWPQATFGPDNTLYVSWEQVITPPQREVYLMVLSTEGN